MKTMEIKSMVKLYMMLLLSDRDLHGYEIMKEIENKLERKASPSQIYPFLKQLEKNHYIESKGRTERDKKVYHLTSEGKKFASTLSNSFGDLLELAVKQKLTKCAHWICCHIIKRLFIFPFY